MCSVKKLVKCGDPGTRFAGYALTKPQDGPHAVWVEFQCTRADAHPVNGSEHWYEHDGVRVTWSTPTDAVWMAESNAERTEPNRNDDEERRGVNQLADIHLSK
jgi:hypothetical protein